MSYRKILLFILFALTLICTGNLYSHDEFVQSQLKIYPALVGHYELTLNGRTLTFNITLRANESKLYFQALSSRPDASPPAKEMLPADKEELTFITQDPVGQKIEIHFEVNKAGELSQCQVSVVDRGWKGQAIKLSDTPKATSQQVQPADSPLTGSDFEQISQKGNSYLLMTEGGTAPDGVFHRVSRFHDELIQEIFTHEEIGEYF